MQPSNSLQDVFSRVVCITLASRESRWKRFRDLLPSDWPFKSPLRFPAVDGSEVELPATWKHGPGAFGCYLSHLKVLEDCVRDGIESVLVLEDDAACLPGFSKHVREFWAELPADWTWVYLGGQHIDFHAGIPRRVSENVYRPFNVNRTHAYGLRSTAQIKSVISHLQKPETWSPKHHIDHRLGELHKNAPVGLYVPAEWIVGQRGGTSDINYRDLGFRLFRGAASIVDAKIDRKMVAVLGPFSGGTSAVAGILHRIGVSMGTSFATPDKTNAGGSYEAVELARFCRSIFKEPWMSTRMNRSSRERLLRIWASGHCENHRRSNLPLGGKHPAFCLLGSELEAAWKNPRFIAVDRSPADIVRSLVRRKWRWPIEAITSITNQLIAEKELFLASTNADFLRVNYDRMLSHPQSTVDAICDFVGVSPNQLDVSDAVSWIQRR